LFHVNALTAFAQSLLCGGTFVLAGRFSASRFWDQVREAGADVTYLLGAMVSILTRRPPSPADRAHGVRVALAPATPAPLVEPFFERFGVRLVEAYASTESNLAIGAPVGEQRPGAMGRVVAGFHARVVDADDVETPLGQPGELLLRSDLPFAFADGYWREPNQTVRAWRNLWLHTGDLVVRDADGWFTFVGRLSDSLRRRGENISAYEVERVLAGHPAIAAVAVFPVPSDLGEDEVMAAVVARDGASLDLTEVIRFCEPRLAYFAVPRFIEVVEALPLTENGKVRKFVLRERGVTATTWDREAAGVRPRRGVVADQS
jgi:carnitine-CoA ligase